MLGFDDTKTERNCLLAVLAVFAGLFLSAYGRLSEKLAAKGDELSAVGQVKLVALTLAVAVVSMLLFVAALAALTWGILGAIWLIRWARRRMAGNQSA